MKVISLWQPWASLAALNLKQNETRSWYTSYRGPLGIHAAKTVIPFEQLFNELEFQQYYFIFKKLWEAYGSYKNLPTGAIVAVSNLSDVIPVEKVIPDLTWLERACGDYSPGRFAWKLKDTVNLKEPIPVKGRQGLWDWDVILFDKIGHMISTESPAHLHEFAQKIGLKRSWYQEKGELSHYDLTTPRMREKARKNGAFEVDPRVLVMILKLVNGNA